MELADQEFNFQMTIFETNILAEFQLYSYSYRVKNREIN